MSDDEKFHIDVPEIIERTTGIGAKPPVVPVMPPTVRTPPGAFSGGPPQIVANAKVLGSVADSWDEISMALEKAAQIATAGWGSPGIFGQNDVLGGEGRKHNEFNQHIVDSLNDGAVVAKQIENGLRSTINVMVGADQDSADNFVTLDERTGGIYTKQP